MEKDKLLKKVNNILEEEGSSNTETYVNSLDEFLLPGLSKTKDTMSHLYSFQPYPKGGLIGKLKNFILNKIKNIVVNILEKQSMRQQKFNDLTVKAIEELIKENKELKAKLSNFEIPNQK